ncbi:MAG: glycosyltransferase [Clostridiales bacterium]|nr:glycosyltransferase [Clostridiales bacterium]
MKKVLIVIQQLRRGGVEIAAVNFSSHLPQEKYEFTYYLQKLESTQDKELLEIVKKQNAKIIIKPENIKGYFQSCKHILKVLSDEKYDIVHSHVMFYSGLILAAAAKKTFRKGLRILTVQNGITGRICLLKYINFLCAG